MSAFLAIAYDDRVEMLTDGAVYAPDGTLTDIKRKVWVADHLPVAISGRGSAVVEAFAIAFRIAASSHSTVDGALEAIAATIARRAEKGVPSDVEMVICAISETRGPLVLYFATADIHRAGIDPWTLMDAAGELVGGTPVDVSDLDGRDGLADIGVEIFERMRRVPGPNPTRPDLPDVHGIGGHVDLTVVRPDGCSTRRLHTWPEDVVGQRIEPLKKVAPPLSFSRCV